MPYLLRSPKSPQVFSTPSSNIATHLHTTHNWSTKFFDPEDIPNVVTTSCLQETHNSTIVIDTDMLDSRKMVEVLRSALKGVGFENPDVKYEGRRKTRAVVDKAVGAVDWFVGFVKRDIAVNEEGLLMEDV